MAMSSKEEQRVSAKVFGCLSAVFAVVLLVGGVLAWQMGASTVKMVDEGLAGSEIYFPPEGDPSFAAEAFPDAQKHAGKQVTNGELAKAYAEDFLGVQLELVGGGKTTSEVSGAAAMDPTNAALQQQAAAMFQLETSMTLMLDAGYGVWVQGTMMKNAGVAALAGGALLLLVAGAQFMRYARLR